jgi:glycosyltransferase involved in cell wall biosynthesis
VGNLGIAQGLDIVLEAAALLRGEPVRFRLVGDGPRRAELARAAGGLGNVDLHDLVPVERVGAVLQACHALLVPLRAHPLLADFMPSKLYDAMAVGRPAIVAAHGEAAALVRETGAGVVVPPEDGAALAAAVRRLRSDPQAARRMGESGRAAAATMARSRQVERLETVLEQAASTRSSE